MEDNQIELEGNQIKIECIDIKEEMNSCDELDKEETIEEEALNEEEVVPETLPSLPMKLYPINYHYAKPPLSYTCLIYMALKNSVNKCLAVPDIYNFVSYNFPFFRTASRNWKSAVRHALSMNANFKKVSTSSKYNQWTFNEDKREQLDRNLENWVSRNHCDIQKTMLLPEKLELYLYGECITLFETNDSGQKKVTTGPKIMRVKRWVKNKSSQNTVSHNVSNDEKEEHNKNNVPFEKKKSKLQILKRDCVEEQFKKIIEPSDGTDNVLETDVRNDNKEEYDKNSDSFEGNTGPKIKRRNVLKRKLKSENSQIIESNDSVDFNQETDYVRNDEKDEYNFVILDNDDNHSQPDISEESQIVGDDIISDPFHVSIDSVDSQDVPIIKDGIKDSGPKELFPRKHCYKGRKPIYLYKYMVMMAFRNSSMEHLTLKQIFNYMYENFSYFNTSKTSYWKRQVCRVLRTESCFKRVFIGGRYGGKRRMVWILSDDLEGKETMEELLKDDQSSIIDNENFPFLAKKNVIPLALNFPDNLKRGKNNKRHELDEEMEISSEEFYGFPFENEDQFDVNDSLQISSDGDNDMDFIEEDLEKAEIGDSDMDESIDSLIDDNNQNENKTLLNVINRLKTSLSKRNTDKMSKFTGFSIFSDKFYKTTFLDDHVIKAKMKCTKCYETFTDFDLLKAHLLNHSVVKATRCVECNKSFARYSDLKSHMLTVHDDLNRYNCTVCNESFNDLTFLKIHMKSHTSMHKCAMCNKIFSRLSDLKVHVLNHANIEAFGCSMCDKVFVKHELLNIHSESHNT